MNIFQQVKEVVTARQAMEQYGIKVNRNGMANPSMKVDKTYICFACGEKGDVINFVANYFGITPYEATKKIAEDFNIYLEQNKSYNKQKKQWQKPIKTVQQTARDFEKWEQKCICILFDYIHCLKYWKKCYAPKPMEEEWSDRFMEALLEIDKTNYYLDLLVEGELEDRITFMIQNGEEVMKIEKRLGEYKRRKEEESRENNRMYGANAPEKRE